MVGRSPETRESKKDPDAQQTGLRAEVIAIDQNLLTHQERLAFKQIDEILNGLAFSENLNVQDLARDLHNLLVERISRRVTRENPSLDDGTTNL